MKNLTLREKTLLGLLLAAGIGYLYYTFLLNPMLVNIHISKQAIEGYNSKLQEIQNILVTNDKFREDYDLTMERYTQYSSRMPYSYRDPEIAYNLMGLVMEKSSVMKSISFGINTQQTVESNKILPIPVNVVIESKDYKNALDLIYLIETDTRMVQIKTLGLATNAAQDSDLSVVQINLGAEYYYIKDDNVNIVDYNFNNGAYGKSDLFK
jgi:Tfp pilus assembly protein PilO